MDREYDSSSNLDHLLDKVERGEDVVISRGGRPIAKLSKVAPAPGSPEALAAAERLINFRRDHKVQGTATLDEILAWRNEGRK
jgi:antitoxin (DNA-binding transcriptional repressor) of toxin-antitoxin stability system